jgi:hypothetical protein
MTLSAELLDRGIFDWKCIIYPAIEKHHGLSSWVERI